MAAPARANVASGAGDCHKANARRAGRSAGRGNRPAAKSTRDAGALGATPAGARGDRPEPGARRAGNYGFFQNDVSELSFGSASREMP